MQWTAVCSSLQYAVRCSMQFAAVCSSLQYAVRCSMQFAAVCSSLQYAVRCSMQFAAVCSSLHVQGISGRGVSLGKLGYGYIRWDQENGWLTPWSMSCMATGDAPCRNTWRAVFGVLRLHKLGRTKQKTMPSQTKRFCYWICYSSILHHLLEVRGMMGGNTNRQRSGTLLRPAYLGARHSHAELNNSSALPKQGGGCKLVGFTI